MGITEYIERDGFLKIISHKPSCPTTDREDRLISGFISAVKNFPAADVRPVVKAHWVYTDMSRLVCSNCGNPVAFALKDDGWHHGDFCPNCGAMMEES